MSDYNEEWRFDSEKPEYWLNKAVNIIEQAGTDGKDYIYVRDDYTGASIRLAELVMQTRGQLKVASKVIRTDEFYTYATAKVEDLRSGSVYEHTARSSIHHSERRLSHEEINDAGNAATSIAVRTAVLRAISVKELNTLVAAASSVGLPLPPTPSDDTLSSLNDALKNQDQAPKIYPKTYPIIPERRFMLKDWRGNLELLFDDEIKLILTDKSLNADLSADEISRLKGLLTASGGA